MQERDLGARTVARRAYTIGLWLLLASILAQFLLAGLGIFTSPLFFYWHASVNGAIVGLLPMALFAMGRVRKSHVALLTTQQDSEGVSGAQLPLDDVEHRPGAGNYRAEQRG